MAKLDKEYAIKRIKEKIDELLPVADTYEDSINDSALINTVQALGNDVDSIHRDKNGNISLSDGHEPNFYLTNMSDKELTALYRVLLTMEIDDLDKKDIIAKKVNIKVLHPFDLRLSGISTDAQKYLNNETLIVKGIDLDESIGKNLQPFGLYGTPVILSGMFRNGIDDEAVTLDDLDFETLDAFESALKGVEKDLKWQESKDNKERYFAALEPFSSHNAVKDDINLYKDMKEAMEAGDEATLLEDADIYDTTMPESFNLSSVFEKDDVFSGYPETPGVRVVVADDQKHTVAYDKSTGDFLPYKEVRKDWILNDARQSGIDENTPEFIKDMAAKEINYIPDNDKEINHLRRELYKFAAGDKNAIVNFNDANYGMRHPNPEFHFEYNGHKYIIRDNGYDKNEGINVFQRTDDNDRFRTYRLSSENFEKLSDALDAAYKKYEKKYWEVDKALEGYVINHDREDWLEFENPLRLSDGTDYVGVQMHYHDDPDTGGEQYYLRTANGTHEENLLLLNYDDMEAVRQKAEHQYILNQLEDNYLNNDVLGHGELFTLAKDPDSEEGIKHIYRANDDSEGHGDDYYVGVRDDDNDTEVRLDNLSTDELRDLTRRVAAQENLAVMTEYSDVFRVGHGFGNPLTIADDGGNKYQITEAYPTKSGAFNDYDDVFIAGAIIPDGKTWKDRKSFDGQLSELKDFDASFVSNLTEQLKARGEQIRSQRKNLGAWATKYAPVDFKAGQSYKIARLSPDRKSIQEGQFDISEKQPKFGTYETHLRFFGKDSNIPDDLTLSRVNLQALHDVYEQTKARKDGTMVQQDPDNILYVHVGEISKDDPRFQKVIKEGNYDLLADLAPLALYKGQTDRPLIDSEDFDYSRVYREFNSSTNGYWGESDRFAVVDKSDYTDDIEVYYKMSTGEALEKARAMSPEQARTWQSACDQDAEDIFNEVVQENIEKRLDDLEAFENRYAPIKIEEGNEVKIHNYDGKDDTFVIDSLTRRPDSNPDNDYIKGHLLSTGQEKTTSLVDLQDMHDVYTQLQARKSGNIIKNHFDDLGENDIYYVLQSTILYDEGFKEVDKAFKDKDYNHLVDIAPMAVLHSSFPDHKIDYQLDVEKDFEHSDGIGRERYEGDRYALVVHHDGHYGFPVGDKLFYSDYGELFLKQTKNEIITNVQNMSDKELHDQLLGADDNILPVFEEALGKKRDEVLKELEEKQLANKQAESPARSLAKELDKELTDQKRYYNFKEPVELSDGTKVVSVFREDLETPYISNPEEKYSLGYIGEFEEGRNIYLDQISADDAKKLYDAYHGRYEQKNNWYYFTNAYDSLEEAEKRAKALPGKPDYLNLSYVFKTPIVDNHPIDTSAISVVKDENNYAIGKYTFNGKDYYGVFSKLPDDEIISAYKDQITEHNYSYPSDDVRVFAKAKGIAVGVDTEPALDANVEKVKIPKPEGRWHQTAQDIQRIYTEDYAPALLWWKDHDVRDGKLLPNHYASDSRDLNAAMKSIWAELNGFQSATYVGNKELEQHPELVPFPGYKPLRVVEGEGKEAHVEYLYQIDKTNIHDLMSKPGEEGRRWVDFYNKKIENTADTDRTASKVISLKENLNQFDDSSRLRSDPRYAKELFQKSGFLSSHVQEETEEINLSQAIDREVDNSRNNDREDTRPKGMRL